MISLREIHEKNNATMCTFNGRTVPAFYHSPEVEYKAVRENILMVDYSSMSVVSVMGDDAWALVNYLASADVSIIRDEQAMYSLVLNQDGTIAGDISVLCTDEGYYLLSENLTAFELIDRLKQILENAADLDIEETPVIQDMEPHGWGAIQLEGPYAWEVLAGIYGFDIIGLPYHEYMSTDDGLMVLRCGKHGEFAYQLIGGQAALCQVWEQLLETGEPFDLKTGGLNYQNTLRVENPCWEPALFSGYSRNPVELQMQWAIQYDKDDFVGKLAAESLSCAGAERKLVGIVPLVACEGIAADDKVRAEGRDVGVIVKSVYSPACQSLIALALIDSEYAYSDIPGFEIATQGGAVAAMTRNVPFFYNFSMLVNPTEHSYIDASKPKSAL